MRHRSKLPGRVIVFLLALSALVLLTSGWATVSSQSTSTSQSSRPSSPQPPLHNPNVIRVEVPIVNVDVDVLDKKGRPVGGLTKDDFTVYENNIQQAITNFDYVHSRGLTSPKPSILSDVPRVSNPPNYMVFLFDNSSMSAMRQQEAKRAVSKFINQGLHPGDYVAVALYRTSLMILQNFTNNKEAILKAVDSAVTGARPFLQQEATGEGPYILDRIPQMIYSPQNSGSVPFRVSGQGLFFGIMGLSDSLAPIEGRKSVVAFTEGGSLPVTSAVNVANRAGVTIYAIDNKQLNANFPSAAPVWQSALEYNPASPESSTVLLSDSNGFYVRNSNDFAATLQQIGSEIRNYYSLGYESSNAPPDGKYRKIRVEVKRRGVHLAYLKGHFSQKPQDALAGTPTAQLLMKSIQTKAAATDGPLRMVADYFYQPAGGVRVPITLSIPVHSLKMGKQHAPDQVSIMGVAFRDDGSVAAQFSDAIPVEIDENRMKTLPADSAIPYSNFFLLEPGKYRFKIAVQDQGGLIGAVEQPVDIPAYRSGQLTTSSLVLSDSMQPVSDLLGNVEAQLLDEKNPLVFKGTRVNQSVAKRFYQNGRMNLFFTVYNLAADPATKAPNLLLSYSIMTPTKILFELPLTRFTDLPKMQNGALPFALTILLGQFPPGSYTVQVLVRDGVTNATRYLYRQFEIKSGAPRDSSATFNAHQKNSE